MPGIAGIISNFEEINLFQSFLNKLNHFNYKIESFYKDGIHLGRVHLDYINRTPQPVFSADKRFALVMLGEIFSYSNSKLEDNIGDGEFLLKLLIKDGLSCLKDINGQFVAALHDFVENETTLISDRHGTRPLYYAIQNKRLFFSSEVKSLLAGNLQVSINMDAISDLFHLRHLFGDKTMFQEILQLPNASTLIFDKGKEKVRIEKYYEFPFGEDIYIRRNFSTSEIWEKCEEFGVVIETAMKRVFANNKKDVLFSLSGGLDSRFVIASAKKNNIDPLVAFTIGPPACGDQVYAKQVADKVGAVHKEFPVQANDFWDNAKKFSYYSDAMSQIFGPVAVMPALDGFFGKKKITVSSQVIDAIVGGTLHRNRIQRIVNADSFSGDLKNSLVNFYNRFSDKTLESVFNDKVYLEIKDGYKIVPEEYMKRYPFPAHNYYMFLLNEYGRRGTLGGNVLSNLFYETRMPSYDNEFMEYALRIPLDLREYQYLYRKVFTSLFPDLAKIKREGTNLPISTSNFRLEMKMMENKMVAYSENIALLRNCLNLVGLNKQKTYLNLGEWFRGELRIKMTDLVLGKQVSSRGLYNPEGLKNIVDQHLNGKFDHSGLLWQIINLEYFFRNFID